MLLFQSSASIRGMGLCSLLILGVLGCGADQYEARLKQSRDYYSYLDRIEQNLAPKWSDGRIVESMRVPRQFQQIPNPVPVKLEDGTVEMPAVDPRQPTYMNLLFPHDELVAAWEAPFNVSVSDGSTESRKAYIYILTNYWKFLGENPAEALEYKTSILTLMGDALENHIPPEKLENPDIELHPKPGGYLPASQYEVYTFPPKPITLPGTERESTVNYTFTMFGKQNGNIQAYVLVVLPENISAQEKMVERIPMMLEHFQITKTEPKASAAQQGGTAPPPTSGF
ncbi:MAG: hypothetical protein JSS49_00940 [Planctomycetes bacterium]|nr:hypothetical protein [Planctomycetota bacterium]